MFSGELSSRCHHLDVDLDLLSIEEQTRRNRRSNLEHYNSSADVIPVRDQLRPIADDGSKRCTFQNLLQSMLISYSGLRWCTSKQPKLGLTQELFFFRISESTTSYTFTPCVGPFTSPGIDIRWKGPPAFSVSSERHRQMWSERNCLNFEKAVGGIEPPSPRLTVRPSTTRPPRLQQTPVLVFCYIKCNNCFVL